MLSSVVVVNHLGQSLTIEMRNPEKSGFLIKNVDGLDPVKADINMNDKGLSDGVVVNSTAVGSRNLIFTLVLLPFPTIEISRQRSYKYFPVRQKVSLQFVSEERVGNVTGYVESNDVNQFSNQVFATISIVCEKAYLTSEKEDNLSFSKIRPAFKFPFGLSLSSDEGGDEGFSNAAGWIMGSFNLYREDYTWRDPENGLGIVWGSTYIYQPVGYYFNSGDVKTGGIIELDFKGPVEDLKLTKRPGLNGLIDYNAPYQEMTIFSSRFLWLVGSDIAAGDKIVINTKTGEKSVKLVRNGLSYNIMHVVGFANWIDFDKEGSFIILTAASGVENVHVKITSPVLYEGV